MTAYNGAALRRLRHQRCAVVLVCVPYSAVGISSSCLGAVELHLGLVVATNALGVGNQDLLRIRDGRVEVGDDNRDAGIKR